MLAAAVEAVAEQGNDRVVAAHKMRSPAADSIGAGNRLEAADDVLGGHAA